MTLISNNKQETTKDNINIHLALQSQVAVGQEENGEGSKG